MINGDLQTKIMKLQSTDTAIMSSGQERRQVLAIWLVNGTGSGEAVTLEITRGGSDYLLYPGKTVAATDYELIKNDGNGPIWAMIDGDSLKGRCATNDAVTVHVIYTSLGGP